MNKRINIFSAQFNYQYGSVIHFPYSIASLVAYVKAFPDLAKNFEFKKTFVFRNHFNKYVSRCKDVDIFICSCYTWNWEISIKIAKKIKELNPKSLIIFGGPQMPQNYKGEVPLNWKKNSSGNFFEDYPFIDMIVHQEGEQIFKDILTSYLGDKDYSKINGIETKEIKTLTAPRIRELDLLPSPYLTNTVWDLVEKEEGVNFISSWETNRGCPFQCTFCDWGSATKSKVRNRQVEILLKEIEWFGENKIPYVDICDANFGIYAERDLLLAKKLKEVKSKTGFPGRVGIAWVKASSERVIPIAKELLDCDLLRAVTVAVQSLDPKTLETIKRSNIKFDKFSNLLQKFRNEKIENYTEIIMGMPGETLVSYKRGLEQLMELFPRPVIFIYNCGVFVNAPMNDPIYIEEHNIKTIRSPIYLWHSSIHNRGSVPEYDDIITSTNSFTNSDLKQMYVYGWTAQAFHSLGILEYVAKFYNQVFNIKYVQFHENLIEYCKVSKSLFSNEYNILIDYLEKGYSGQGWDHYDKNLAPIFWPIEEATWLRCVTSSNILNAEILKFLKFFNKKNNLSISNKIVKDLIKFQVFILSTMDHKEEYKKQSFNFVWNVFFQNNDDNLKNLKEYEVTYSWKNKVTIKDKAEWCYKAIWVGRNQGNYKCHPEFLNYSFLNKKIKMNDLRNIKKLDNFSKKQKTVSKISEVEKLISENLGISHQEYMKRKEVLLNKS